MEHTGFPSDETLAAFLDGRLDPETRRRVVEHMTTCDECYSVVMGGGNKGALAMANEMHVRHPHSLRQRWAHVAAITALAILSSIALVLVNRSRMHPQDSLVMALAKAAP